MDNQEAFESSELYVKRYNKAPALLVWPTVAFIFLMILLSMFCKTDVSVKSKGMVLQVNKEQTSFYVESFIPANKIVSVKKGQTVYLSLPGNLNVNSSVKSKVVKIYSKPTTINGSVMYRVISFNHSKIASKVRYGMNGNISIILKKDSYFGEVYRNIFSR